MSDEQPIKEAMASQPVPFYEVFRQTVPPIDNWHQWLKLARNTTTLDEKLGLLYLAFDVGFDQGSWDPDAREYKPLYTHVDRLDFFFGLADGWEDSDLLRTEGVSWQDEPKYLVGHDESGSRIERTESGQRQVLARKAFYMLVAKFFRMPSVMREKHLPTRDEKEINWMEKFVFGKIFLIVQNFFRIDETSNTDVKIRNLPHHWRNEKPSQQEKHVTAFLLKLARFLLSWKEASINSYEPKKNREKKEEKKFTKRTIVDDAKPWMIEVLSALGELNVLDEWSLDLDEASLATLRKIALRNEFSVYADPVIKGRRVATIEEALYLGSQAALLIKRHETMVSEDGRLKAILKAQQTKRRAERDLHELTK